MSDTIIGGMAVDIMSGKPRERGPTEREKLMEGQLEAEASAGIEAEQKLKTRAGKFFVIMIEKALQQRIESLVNADPESIVLLRLLDGLGHDIQVGEAAAKRLTRIRLGRQAREVPNIG
jgi:hypothetical protein